MFAFETVYKNVLVYTITQATIFDVLPSTIKKLRFHKTALDTNFVRNSSAISTMHEVCVVWPTKRVRLYLIEYEREFC